jgi:hypothetical protein
LLNFVVLSSIHFHLSASLLTSGSPLCSIFPHFFLVFRSYFRCPLSFFSPPPPPPPEQLAWPVKLI